MRNNNYYLPNMLVFAVGISLALLGGFMVGGVYDWPFFDVWMPLSFLLIGIIILSSKIYSAWFGFLLISLSGFIMLHSYAFTNFENVTRTIDWSFVIIGNLIIILAIFRTIKQSINRYSHRHL